MIIKEREWTKCECCDSRKLTGETVYGCNTCKTVLDLNDPQANYLSITIFRHDSEASEMQFCSWVCVLKGLATVETDNFVSLPFLHYDERDTAINVKSFFEAIADWKAEPQLEG